MADHHAAPLHLSTYAPSKGVKNLALAAMVFGLLTFMFGVFKFPERAWPAYLTSFFYFVGLTMGAMFFIAINHMTNAGWSASIRRAAESLASFSPYILLFSFGLFFGMKFLYPWADPVKVAEDSLIQVKTAYLNSGFFFLRMFIFGGLAIFFWKKMVGNSIAQDKTGDHALTKSNRPLSIAFMFFFSLGFSIFSVDLLMSLIPHWYSTIFGIYCFAGLIQATFAFLILLVFALKNSGAVSGYINIEHIHDLAKFLKGFTVFWAYIAFSQYMLIWYANIPEETEFFLMRAHGAWLPISLLLLFFRFIVPFLLLLPRAAKRCEKHLTGICILVLIMHFVDIYWLVYPNFNDNEAYLGFIDLGVFAGFLGLFLTLIFGFFARNNAVAIKDPRLHEAISHHVAY